MEIPLTAEDAVLLARLAHHYETVIGPARHLLIWTLPPKARRKYQYIVEESRALNAVATTAAASLSAGSSREVEFSRSDAVAFWGRILSCLNTKRSRRRLSTERLAAVENLEGGFRAAVRGVWERDPDGTASAVATRRARERRWMEAALAASADPEGPLVDPSP